MHSRQGIISKAVIESVRRALHNKYVEDSQIKCMLEEFLTEDLTPQELEITGHAYQEVKNRLAYSAVLDGLWQEIEETQILYDELHVYDSLEKEYSSAKTRLEHEDLPIDSVDLEEVHMGEDGHTVDKSLVTREIGAIIARGNQTLAERHDGAIVARHHGSVAIRPLQNLDVVRNIPFYGTGLSMQNTRTHAVSEEGTEGFEEDAVVESESRKHKKDKRKSKCKEEGKKGGCRKGENLKGDGRKSKKSKHKRYEKVEPLDFDALEAAGKDGLAIPFEDDIVAKIDKNVEHNKDKKQSKCNHKSEEKKKEKSKEKVKTEDKSSDDSLKVKKGKTKRKVAQILESKDGELYLKDILALLEKDGSEAGSLEDIIRNTEWKEFKQLTKRAKKALKRARKAAKERLVEDLAEHYGEFTSDMRDPEETGATNTLEDKKAPVQEPHNEEAVETRESHEVHEEHETHETREAHTEVSVEEHKKHKQEFVKTHKKHTKSKK